MLFVYGIYIMLSGSKEYSNVVVVIDIDDDVEDDDGNNNII